MNNIQLPNRASIAFETGDITCFSADAIVNAANAYLAVGGSVSGAIHAAAGPELKEECDRIVLERGPLNVSEAVATRGYRLNARFVIHALGPVWYGSGDEAAELEKAYLNALSTANGLALRSIAFPSISTGVFGYPTDAAAPVALRAVAKGLLRSEHVCLATFVLYDEEALGAFHRAAEGFSANDIDGV